MTKEEALKSLITFAPSWCHSIEDRIAYVEGNIEQRFSLFIHQGHDGPFEIFFGQDLEILLTHAKNFIYLTRIEQLLTEPNPLCP